MNLSKFNNRYILLASLMINVVFITSSFYYVAKHGGVDYFTSKYNNNSLGTDGYYNLKTSIFSIFNSGKKETVFLGDSITDNCEWHELFENANIKNRGIQGDVLQGVLSRIEGITKSKPDKIFLMIGINDLKAKRSTTEILKDYATLVRLIKEQSPNTRLYIESILPRNGKLKAQNSDIRFINKELIALSLKNNVVYIDLYNSFADNNGDLKVSYTYDGLHPNGEGYRVWKNKIQNLVIY